MAWGRVDRVGGAAARAGVDWGGGSGRAAALSGRSAVAPFCTAFRSGPGFNSLLNASEPAAPLTHFSETGLGDPLQDTGSSCASMANVWCLPVETRR